MAGRMPITDTVRQQRPGSDSFRPPYAPQISRRHPARRAAGSFLRGSASPPGRFSRASRPAGTWPRSDAVKKSRSSVGRAVRRWAGRPPPGKRLAPARRSRLRACPDLASSRCRRTGCLYHWRPRCPDGPWEHQVIPQVGEQRTIDVGKDVRRPPLLQDDLVYPRTVRAPPHIEHPAWGRPVQVHRKVHRRQGAGHV
jgi:hypothetical protein